ncbi:MAG TPA: hypothetical protein VL501_09835 [Pyrinomonadaceae bacterium]|nr:hypothetical protein [Pyrinomonadaceae bacterium]
MQSIAVQKAGSVTSRLGKFSNISYCGTRRDARVGDVVVVRALGESSSYGNLELASGRLAKINRGDVLLGALGKRRALKGFVGDVPATIAAGDRLHLLNMGGVMGICEGHHSSLSDAIELEVIGVAHSADGEALNIADGSVELADVLAPSAPIVMIAGSCMNSGKTVAATEIIKQASAAGYKVAAAKISGVACLRDTLNMKDHGAFETVSFLDCGLPSTVDHDDLPTVAKGLLNHLNSLSPDLIVVELGDGIVGGYSVDDVLRDREIMDAVTSLVFCASDYVGVIGGSTVLNSMGLAIDVVAGSVTDSQMGEDYVQSKLGLAAGNARRNGKRLFDLVSPKAVQVRLAA